MAVITLTPGESFEHYHLDESITAHVEGEIQLTVSGKSTLLTEGERVIIPAKTSHTTKNIGNVDARFRCYHPVTEGDEAEGDGEVL